MSASIRWLLALVGGFLLLGAGYSVANPIYEAPDEFWHYGYVRHLALTGQLPIESQTRTIAHQEASQPPLYYAVAAFFVRWVPDLDDSRPYFRPNPNSRVGDLSAGPGERNAVFHDTRDGICGPDCVATHLARLVNLLFGSGTVIATFLLGQEVFGRGDRRALLAAATAAAVPQFLYVSSAVTNDAAVACFSTATLVTLVRLYRGHAGPSTLLAVGACIGLAALSKASGLLLLALALPLALVVPLRPSLLLLDGQAESGSERGSSRARSLASSRPLHGPIGALIAPLVVLAPVALTCGWWFARNLSLFGDPTAIRLMLSSQGRRDLPIGPLEVLAREGFGLWQSYWAVFGWSNVPAPAVAYLAFGVLTLAAAAGLLHLGWQTLRRRPGAPFAAPTPLLALLGIWGLLVLAGLVRWSMLTEASHGRLLFPAHGAIAVLLATGWHALAGVSTLPRTRGHGLLAAGPVLALGLLALAMPWTIVAAYR